MQHDVCADEIPLSIQLYMQRYPTGSSGTNNKRYVNVLVLENYTSRKYHLRMEDMINEMKFQQMRDNSSKYMRIATELPNAFITFGNNQNTLRIHEASTCMEKAEREALDMSKFLHHIEDLVLSRFIEIISEIVTDSLPSGSVQLGNNQLAQEVFHLPVGKSSAYDAPNSVVSHISKRDPYAPHSDSRPIKPFNHDNNSVWHHEDSMRIPTHCHVFSSDGGSIPEEIITIRHGVPTGMATNFCEQVGCFSSKENKFIFAKRKDIPIGGDSHLHYQMAGSQAELHHYLERSHQCRHVKMVRVVLSTRTLRDPQIVMNEDHFKKPPQIIPHYMHQHLNTLSSLKGQVGIASRSVIRTLEEEHSCRVDLSQDTEAIKKLSESKWVSKKHKTGDLLEQEMINRKAIVGINSSYPVGRVATSKTVAAAICRKQTAFRYTDEEGNSTLVGPTLSKDDDGNLVPIKPGEKMQVADLNRLYNIDSCRLRRKVTNMSKDNTLGSGIIVLRRIAKNTASVLNNVIRAIQGRPLTDVVIRGEGGIIGKASQHGLDCVSLHAYREAPTHTVSVGQFANQFSESLTNSCCSEQVFNLFYAPSDIAIYLGLFWAKEIWWKTLDKTQCAEELEQMSTLTEKVYELDSSLMKSPTIKEDAKNEVGSMRSPSMNLKLQPLFPALEELNYRVRWQLVDVSPGDFCLPKIAINKEDVSVRLGFNEESTVGSVAELLEVSSAGMEFLTQEARRRIFPDMTSPTYSNITFVHGADKLQIRLEDMLCAAIHSAGMTLAKTFEPETVKWNEENGCLVLIPPRRLLNRIGFYNCNNDELNLKPLFSRPIHPPHLMLEPAVVLAFESSKRHMAVDKRQKGYGYITNNSTEHNAFVVIFKCIVCSILNPSALLQIFDNLNQQEAPSPSETDLLVDIINKFEWSRSSVVHANFDSVFDRLEQLIGFIEWTSGEECRRAFQDAARTKCRMTAHSILHQRFNQAYTTHNKFNEFHVHVIMRTIENCLMEPFGRPTSVPHGHGSAQAAKFLDKVLRCGVNHVDKEIVQMLNDRYRAIHKNGSSSKKTIVHLKRELLVLGLDWCPQRKCVVHVIGVKKEFDVLDAEHMLCMAYTMYQRTLPSRNDAMKSEIDCPKCFPIHYCSGSTLSQELGVMESLRASYSNRIQAYEDLLSDNSYEYRRLSDIFRIDIIE